MHAWHDRWLFCAGGHCARCMSLIEGNFEPHCHVCLAVHLCWHVVFCPSETQLQNCGRLQNALQQRVPTNAAPSLSRWTRWTQMRLLPARRFVSAVLPCATNLAEHESPIPGQTQGVSCAASDSPGCKRFTVSSPASCCCSHACPPSKIIITPKTCYLCRMMSQHMRKAAVLIGGRTKTAQSKHELMKGRIFCPRVFCLVPAEKRDTLCSASMLSAAITVYTAAWEPNPCAFWHGAPQCLTRSTNVWPGHQGNTTVTQEDQRIIFVGTRSTRALKESRCACMVGAEQLRALMLWVFAVVRPSEQSFTVASQIS